MIELLCGRQDRQVMLYFNLSSFSSSISWVNFLIFLQPECNKLIIFCSLRYAEDPWLWELDWAVQDIRTKKLKPPKKKRKTKAKEDAVVSGEDSATDVSTPGETISDILSEDEMLDDNNIEVVEGLKNSSDILATIPSAADVMYKRRQNMPGYPK